MDLKEETSKYVALKRTLEAEKKELETLKEEEKKLFKEQGKQERDLKRAKKSGDVVARQAAEDALKEIEEKIEKHRYSLVRKMRDIEISEKSIDEKISEIQQLPEMKEAMNEALSKRYDRQLAKLKPEREKLDKDRKEKEINKQGFEILKRIIREVPDSDKKLVKLIEAKQEIAKLNEELGKLDYKKPSDQARIAEIHAKLIPDLVETARTNKKDIVKAIDNKGISFKEEELEKLVKLMIKNGLVLDGKGSINIEQTLDDSIDITNEEATSLERRIKSYDKQIGNYTFAKKQITTERTEPVPGPQPQSNPQTEQPKWYQLIKRFNEWNEARKQKKLPEPEPEPDTEKIDKRDIFRNELMRDAFNKGIGESGKYNGTFEKEALKSAKVKRKEKEAEELPEERS